MALATRIFDGPGFEPFGVDAVVKFGGSLLGDLDEARALASTLAGCAQRHRLAVFPGGGPADKLLEGMAREVGIPSDVLNPAYMRALDQTGLFLSALEPSLEAVGDLRALRGALRPATVPVLLPSALVLALDVFIRHDLITSDTLGSYFAFLLGAPTYVVLTDVDGVYRPDATAREGDEGLVRRCTPAELTALGATSVDACLGPFAEATGLRVWVLNGRRPERLADALDGAQPLGTLVEEPGAVR